MPIPIYLAMTESEMADCTALPPKIAWMSCLFSPYGTGLTGIPQTLPLNSILILNDRIPFLRQDQNLIVRQLKKAMNDLRCESLLLDFQQPDVPELRELIEKLSALDHKICVSVCYSNHWGGPILVPPVPLGESVEAYLQKWGGREIWLEIEQTALKITVTEDGSNYLPMKGNSAEEYPYFCKELLCHYHQKITDTAEFYLKRTQEDLTELVKLAKDFGVTRGIGFYSEFPTNIDKNSTE